MRSNLTYFFKFNLFAFFFLALCFFSKKGIGNEWENFRLTLDKRIDKDLEIKDFRTTNDEFKRNDSPLILPSRKGLELLQASGSSQFTEQGLNELLDLLPDKNIYLVDLRRESHGFIDGLSVSWISDTGWSNLGMSANEIIETEKHLLQEALQKKVLAIAVMNKVNKRKEVIPALLFPSKVITEEELCQSKKIHYTRIPVEDHLRASDQEVDNFIAFVKNLPNNSWIHFHCKGGSGRTTSFLIMLDMLYNAKQISAEEIIKRHWLLGKSNLADSSKQGAIDYPKQFVIRLEFLRQFHQYCKDNNDNYQTSWSSYVENFNQHIEKKDISPSSV